MNEKRKFTQTSMQIDNLDQKPTLVPLVGFLSFEVK